jgi:predicted dehydrogenase
MTRGGGALRRETERGRRAQLVADGLRVAVIGCGSIGRAHLESYRLARVEIAAICDLDRERLAAAGDAFGVARRFERYDDLLAADRYDLVSVCTMPVTHREVAVAALAAGANVLCEKPPALNASEVAAMIRAAEAAGRFLTFGFNMRYLPNARILKRFVEGGGLGRPLYTRAWTFATDIPWWGKHWVKSISGGGDLASTAVHILDLALWMAGDPQPVAASASMTRLFPAKRGGTAPDEDAAAAFDVEDTFSGHIRFADGSWMTLEGGWSYDRLDYSYSFEMTGQRAAIRFDPLQIVGERDGVPVDLTGEHLAPAEQAAATWQGGWRGAINDEIADVVAAVRDGRAPLVTARQALTVQATIDALYRSAEAEHEVAGEIPGMPAST